MHKWSSHTQSVIYWSDIWFKILEVSQYIQFTACPHKMYLSNLFDGVLYEGKVTVDRIKNVDVRRGKMVWILFLIKVYVSICFTGIIFTSKTLQGMKIVFVMFKWLRCWKEVRSNIRIGDGFLKQVNDSIVSAWTYQS